jgi:hypothetical protein
MENLMTTNNPIEFWTPMEGATWLVKRTDDGEFFFFVNAEGKELFKMSKGEFKSLVLVNGANQMTTPKNQIIQSSDWED